MSLKQQLFENLEETQSLYKAIADNDERSSIMHLHNIRQQAFRKNYQDYFQQARYQPALEFILTDVYSSLLHEKRDAKITKAFNNMSRVLPETILETIAKAVCFNCDMLRLDSQLIRQAHWSTELSYKELLTNSELNNVYIDLVHDFISLAEMIDYFVKKPLMQMTLKASRIPARAANLGELQEFLESCFKVFKTMRSPHAFLKDYKDRELSLITH